MMQQPFSEAADRNKSFILEILQNYIQESSHILEIGSGTAQHISFFAKSCPSVSWQPSDVISNSYLHSLSFCEQKNILKPLALDVRNEDDWPQVQFDIVYSANTAHIMEWQTVVKMLQLVGKVLKALGYFILYGPFKFAGKFTSASNHRFDNSLKIQSSAMGIRDFSEIEKVAKKAGLTCVEVCNMPANNKILVFAK